MNFSHDEKKTQWSHPRTGKTKRVYGELPFGWEKEVRVRSAFIFACNHLHDVSHFQIEEESGQVIYVDRTNDKRTYIDPRLAFAVENLPRNISEIRQRFDCSSTAFQVLHGQDLTEKVAVVTGANCGIGFETCRSLAFFGCRVLLACRSQAAAEEAIRKIAVEKASAGERCSFISLDLCSLASVKIAATQICDQTTHIDLLILNAGVFGLPHTLTPDNLETTFQVSHLSHFYLSKLLERRLDRRSRVVVLSSESHRFSSLPPIGLSEDVLSPPPSRYSSMTAYNNAKLCNVLFARGLAKVRAIRRNEFIDVIVFSYFINSIFPAVALVSKRNLCEFIASRQSCLYIYFAELVVLSIAVRYCSTIHQIAGKQKSTSYRSITISYPCFLCSNKRPALPSIVQPHPN